MGHRCHFQQITFGYESRVNQTIVINIHMLLKLLQYINLNLTLNLHKGKYISFSSTIQLPTLTAGKGGGSAYLTPFF